MPPYLLSEELFQDFLHRFSTGVFPRAEWNHAAHIAMAAAAIHNGADHDAVRARILAYNDTQGIVSTPTYGYHETLTRFWVDHIRELLSGLGRGATAYDASRAAVAAFAHRGRLFDRYYTFDVVQSSDARTRYISPDLA